MKRALTASVVAGSLAIATIATPTSAQAQWGRRGWGLGLGGLAVGLFIGAALSRPVTIRPPFGSRAKACPLNSNETQLKLFFAFDEANFIERVFLSTRPMD